jgi:hypothetical protein
MTTTTEAAAETLCMKYNSHNPKKKGRTKERKNERKKEKETEIKNE